MHVWALRTFQGRRFHEKDPQEREERVKIVAGEGITNVQLLCQGCHSGRDHGRPGTLMSSSFSDE